MKPLLAILVLFLVSGCHNYSGNVGDVLGCTLAGNGCVSQGYNGRDGAQGPQGERGEDGADGQDGLDGVNGNDGRDGTNGTQISVVKLCPGETIYPSVFVEVAFCIDGKLYATYSTHGGFSTEIPPGNYLSNTVGSRCNFTVEPLCVVRN